MSNLAKLEIAELDISENNYMRWAVATKMHLKGSALLDAIDKSKTTSDEKKAKTMIFLFHHIHDGLKDEYIIKKYPADLWQSLKDRFDHQKYVILPKAKHEWLNLRFQDYKSVSEDNSALFGITSRIKLCGEEISEYALVSTLIGLAASNLGIISSEGPAFAIVLNFLLPLAVPLLLFRADLRRVIQSTGKLLLAFLIGSVATTVGTALAYFLVPMKSLGSDSWKIAAALMGRHIGGAVNYVAIANYLDVTPSVLAAGLAADNVICAVYFSTLFALGSKIPAESAPPPTTDVEINKNTETTNKIPVIKIATGIAVSLAICKAGAFLTKYLGISGGILPVVTAVVVILATVFPSQFGSLAPSGEAMALILMQVFFTVIGASGNIWSVINTAPSIFLFALVQIGTHLAVILGIGKLFNIELRLLLLASNANVGGPTTAAGMATAKGWNSLIVPGILAGIFGISIATFLGISFGGRVLQFM